LRVTGSCRSCWGHWDSCRRTQRALWALALRIAWSERGLGAEDYAASHCTVLLRGSTVGAPGPPDAAAAIVQISCAVWGVGLIGLPSVAASVLGTSVNSCVRTPPPVVGRAQADFSYVMRIPAAISALGFLVDEEEDSSSVFPIPVGADRAWKRPWPHHVSAPCVFLRSCVCIRGVSDNTLN
jgi:hypothetical protein